MENFPCSSARAHTDGVKDEVLGEKLFKENQREAYAEFIRASIPEEQMKSIRYYTRTGRPFGSKEFIRNMEEKLDLRGDLC